MLIALCSYYLGLALAVLPHAHRGLKEAGIEMAQDAGTAIALSAIVVLLASGVDAVFRFMGFGGLREAFDQFSRWISSELFLVLGSMYYFEALPILADAADAFDPTGSGAFGVLASYLRIGITPWRMILSGYAMMLALIQMWANFIVSQWIVLLVIGAIIFALPARIGRIAGGWLIALALAYLFFLPFMGFFVDGMTGIVMVDVKRFLAAKLEGGATDPWAALTMLFSAYDLSTLIIVRLIFSSLYLTFIFAGAWGLARQLGAAVRRPRLPGVPTG